jgi:hypothetical protein
MSMRAALHPICAMIARQGCLMRIWPLFLLALSACSTFDAGPPPVPAATVAAPVVAPLTAPPTDPAIRPLTEDQRAMLDG